MDFYITGFYLLAVITVAASFMVVYMRNPLVSALFLALSFIGLSGLFIFLDAVFLGLVQVLIYAGAIVVLFIYVIMLLDLSPEKVQGIYGLFMKILGGILLAVVAFFLFINMFEAKNLEFVNWCSCINVTGSLAWWLFLVYIIPFELISIVLMVGIIGAVLLVKKVEKKI